MRQSPHDRWYGRPFDAGVDEFTGRHASGVVSGQRRGSPADERHDVGGGRADVHEQGPCLGDQRRREPRDRMPVARGDTERIGNRVVGGHDPSIDSIDSRRIAPACLRRRRDRPHDVRHARPPIGEAVGDLARHRGHDPPRAGGADDPSQHLREPGRVAPHRKRLRVGPAGAVGGLDVGTADIEGQHVTWQGRGCHRRA